MRTNRWMMVLAILVLMAACGGGAGPASEALTGITPADGATGIPVTQAITATFSKDLDQATLTPANITLTRGAVIGGTNVPGQIAYDAASFTLTFTPDELLVPGTLYTFTIAAAAQTKAAGDYAITFTTQEVPLLLAISDDTSNLPINVASMDRSGANLTNLTNFTDKAVATVSTNTGTFMAWSPDYTRIAFLVTSGTDPNTSTNLYVMDANGANPQNLTNGGANYSILLFRWAPDGSQIYFLYTADDSASNDVFDIGSVALNGEAPRNLTNMTGGMRVLPSGFQISRDGAHIAYVVGKTDGNPPLDVYVIPGGGGTPTKLTSAAADTGALYPVFSADGTRLYYSYGNSTTGMSLNAIDVSGGTAQVLIPATAGKWLLAANVSPDGTQLLLTRFAPSSMQTTGEVILASADGATVTPITTPSATSSAWVGEWSWAPNGGRILYLEGDIVNGPTNLVAAGSDGSGPANITGLTGDAMIFTFDSMFLQLGTGIGYWSPEGTQFVFSQTAKSTNAVNVAIADIAGTAATPLTSRVPPAIAAVADWW